MTYENDLEFFDNAQQDQTDLKAAIWEDHTFREYVSEVGLKETLYDVTAFHRSVADNLRFNQIADLKEAPEWAKKAVRLAARLKARRQQLRTVVRNAYGQEAVDSINAQVAQEAGD